MRMVKASKDPEELKGAQRMVSLELTVWLTPYSLS